MKGKMKGNSVLCFLSPEQIKGAPRRTVVMGYIFEDDFMSQHKLIERVEGSIILVPHRRSIAKVGTATEGAQLEDIVKEGNVYMRPEYWQESPDGN